MRKIHIDEIAEKLTVCPYCMGQVNDSMLGHCGESRAHFETAFELNSGEILLSSEIEITKGVEND